jgi:hypothetical protein
VISQKIATESPLGKSRKLQLEHYVLGTRWVTIFRQNSTGKTQGFRIGLPNRQKRVGQIYSLKSILKTKYNLASIQKHLNLQN